MLNTSNEHICECEACNFCSTWRIIDLSSNYIITVIKSERKMSQHFRKTQEKFKRKVLIDKIYNNLKWILSIFESINIIRSSGGYLFPFLTTHTFDVQISIRHFDWFVKTMSIDSTQKQNVLSKTKNSLEQNINHSKDNSNPQQKKKITCNTCVNLWMSIQNTFQIEIFNGVTHQKASKIKVYSFCLHKRMYIFWHCAYI